MIQVGAVTCGAYLHDSYLSRNSQRTGRENIPAIGLVDKIKRLEIPSYAEGFDRLYYVTIDPVNSQFIIKEWKAE